MDESAEESSAWLDEIESRAAAAMPGPWVSLVAGRDHTSGDTFIRTGGTDGPDVYVLFSFRGDRKPSWTAEDNDFIAGARQDVPALIEEVWLLRRSVRSQSTSTGQVVRHFDVSDGTDTVTAHIDDNDPAVMVKVVASGGDPVELTAAEARRLASALLDLAEALDKSDEEDFAVVTSEALRHQDEHFGV